jgi:precorrin-6Y C5,15-methyltransferase (decarboxylating)
MKKEVYIIGAGPGQTNLLTKVAYDLIMQCEAVYSFERIASLNYNLRPDICICTYREIIDRVNASQAKKIAVLVSGDIGFFSITETLISKLDKDCSIQTLCGISSMQYFSAKIGISYEGMNVVSLHGRNKSIFGNIAYHQYVFVLTDGVNSANKICKDLCENGLSHLKVYVGEYLSMENERIIEGSAQEIGELEFNSLAVLVIENPQYIDKSMPLFDEDFLRAKVPMTKEAIRWTSVNNLKISAQDIVFDIGAGTGSVSIEMARKAHEGLVYAVEKNENAYDLLKDNIKHLGAYNVIPILGEAYEEIKKLPVPNKAFIGGSGGNLKDIINYLYRMNKEIQIVVNAITLETLTTAIEAFKAIDFQTKIICINSAKSQTMGQYNLMVANNPVYIISGDKNGK